MWTQYVNFRGDYPHISHEVARKLTRNFASMVVANLRGRGRVTVPTMASKLPSGGW